MSAPMIAAAVGMMVCCSSSVAAMMMGDDTKKKEDDSDSDDDADADADDGSPDPYATFCGVAKTDWINSKLQNDGMPQTQGESLQNCKVPNNLQSRIK